MKTPHSLFIILIVLLFSILSPATAQENSLLEKVYAPPLVKTLETGETEIELQQVLPTPTWGVFYSFSGQFPPTPFPPNPELGLPVYFWNEGIFLFDDEGLNMKELGEAGVSLFNTGNAFSKANRGESFLLSEGPPAPGEGGDSEESSTNSLPPAFSYTNGELYLDIDSYDSNWMTLKIVNTMENGFYEILTKTNLSEPTWTVDHGVIGLDNLTLANAISVSGKPNLFFLARNSGQDEDGDGLPDWWEIENGFDPTFSDTGNTGTSDGYKDGDGDGWTNLEEFQNGTSPGGFNTPPAPRGLTVSPNSIGTVASLGWNPSGGAVTGYIIERISPSYLDNTSFTNSANPQVLVDTSVPTGISPGSGFPVSYRIQANYTLGNSSWSSYVPMRPPGTSSWFWLIRGPSGLFYLVTSAVAADVTGIKITQSHYNEQDIEEFPAFTISMTNFVNGVALITAEQVFDARPMWAQTLKADGTLGAFTFVYPPLLQWYSSQFVPFFDGREQLKQNLSFMLRAADMETPFHFSLNSEFASDIHWGTENYAYASYYEFLHDEYDFSVELNKFKPFEENYLYRNFAFDTAHLNESGKITNGISRNEGWSIPLLTEAIAPYHFPVPNTPGPITAILSSNVTERIFHQKYEDRIGIGFSFDEEHSYHTLASGSKNIFGLDYLSVRTAYSYSSLTGVEFHNVYPGGSIPADGDYFYPEVAEPQLRTVSYYFGREDVDPFPGSIYFDPTNTTPLIIFSGNFPSNPRLAGYAKQAIDNGDPNKFGFLGLYFDKAFKVNPNGTISTNETGILSEYGEFFPTEPGRVVLMTKPEAIGETNVGAVLIHTIKLELDVNHDGTIDRTITGPDNTSYFKPFVFWMNNDNDGVSGVGQELENGVDYIDGKINSTRDLEDFARLWISGVPSLPASEGYSVSLSWNYSLGTKIKIYPAAETDGGMGYLTNSTTASQQLTLLSGNQISPGQTMGEISSGSPFIFLDDFFDGTRKHFLFEGSAAGSDDLVLTISKNGQPIVSTSVSIQIKNIKEMYEQVFGNNVSSDFPPSTLTSEFRITRPLADNASEARQTIVFVHGINNTDWEYRNTSETMFKRLYWSGYQGRLASFHWPSPLLPNCNGTGGGSPFNYNKGEYIAFKSANALKGYLQSLTNRLPDYTINILAHSMGGIVTSEALRLGAPFNNCILSQAAVPAHAYDVNAPFLQKFLDAEPSKPTPFTVAQGGYHGYFTNLTGNIINFYNTNDYALVSGTCPLLGEANWEKNHVSLKPVFAPISLSSIAYSYSTNTQESYADLTIGEITVERTVTDAYEKKAMVARTRSAAVGAEPNVAGVINTNNSVDLRTQFGFDRTRDEHSAQFTRNIQTVRGYYNEIFRILNPSTP